MTYCANLLVCSFFFFINVIVAKLFTILKSMFVDQQSYHVTLGSTRIAWQVGA